MSSGRVYLAQYSVPYFTNLPGDVVTNNLHFTWDPTPDPVSADFDALAGMIQDFYNDIYGVMGLAIWCVKANANVTFYDLSQPTPRVPIQNNVIPITNTQAATNTPTEVALVLSYKADDVPGISPARTRGRIYVGGIADPVSNGSSSTFPEVPSIIRTTCATALEDFRAAVKATDWLWRVYSPTQTAAGGGAQEVFEVTNGFIDNTPDTQRRRGIEATARTLWP